MGKTTTCRLLLDRLQPSAYLDADWCWTMRPFPATAEDKAMVHDNITHLLRGYLRHSAIETVILSWVMHRREIFDAVLKPLEDVNFEVACITLTMAPEVLVARLAKDISEGIRSHADLDRSLLRLHDCRMLDTCKLDTGAQSAAEACDAIVSMVAKSGTRIPWRRDEPKI